MYYEAEDMYDFDAHAWDAHDDSIQCNLCDFTLETERELNKHKEEEHKNGPNNCLECKFCEQVFQSKKVLMGHSKIKHSERVSVCWKFTSGDCVYGSEKCWFNHYSTEKCEIKCNYCEEIFSNQSQVLTHRKQNHRQFVAYCRNFKNGTCNYTNKNCWFKHNENEILNENENNEKEIEENREVIQKIFKMMENFTNEIIQLKELKNLQ